MASQILRACYHYAVYAIGIVVLIAAVLVSAVRVAFPDLGCETAPGNPDALDELEADQATLL